MTGLSIKSLPSPSAILRRLSRFSIWFFVLLLSAVYGLVMFKIITLSTAQPDDSEVASQVKAAAVPHVDPTALKQIQDLQDNSVSVQTLFNQTRSNPFQE